MRGLDDYCHWLTAKKDWCCCMALIIVTAIFTIFIVKMGFWDSFWNLIIWFVDVVIYEGMSNWITAVATSLAACFAYCAYKQSLKARKSAAFSTLFAQLIENHKSIFENKENPESSFASLFKLFKGKIDSGIPESISPDFVERMYNEGLGDDTYFSHCFKYIYYEIKTVLDEKSLDDGERKHYIGIVQACMTYDELFCYFINLLHHFSKKGWRREDRSFMKGLKRNDFFKNLTEGHNETYKKLIKDLYIRSSNDKDHKIQNIIECIIKKDYFLH